MAAGKGTGGGGTTREAGPGGGGREKRPQRWSRGSLKHPQEKVAEGEIWVPPRISARVGALLECNFLLSAPTF
jgi:hypothetical protein